MTAIAVPPAAPRTAARVALPVLLLLATALRVAWWAGYVDVIENEGVEYARLAWNWFHGQGYISIFGGTHTLFPPFYPLLIGIVAPLAGSEEVAARLVSLLAGLGVVAAAYAIAHALFDARVALAAGLLAAVHPVLVALSVSTYSEALYIGLGLAATWAAVAGLRSPSRLRAAAVGLFAGLAYLTRPEGIAVAPGLAALLLLAGGVRDRAWRRGASDAVLALGIAVLLATPYVTHLSRAAGAFRWEGKSSVNNSITARMDRGLTYGEAARGLDADGNPAGPFLFADQHALLAHRHEQGAGLLAALVHTPLRRIRQIASRVATGGFLGSPVLVVLVLLGLTSGRWWRTRLPEALATFVLPAIAVLALLTLRFVWDRYYFVLVPAGVIWGGAGVVRLGQWARDAARHASGPGFLARRSPPAVLALSALAIVLLAGPRVARLQDFSQTRLEVVRTAGEWLAADHATRGGNTPPRIALVGLAVAHYARGIATYLPHADEGRTLPYLHRLAPDYVVLRANEAERLPYGRDWLQRGPPTACALPARLPAGVGPAVQIWRWSCRSPPTRNPLGPSDVGGNTPRSTGR